VRVAADVAEGDLIDPVTFPVRRADLVAYAGASGDYNVIHWSTRAAIAVGLPDVIAHGMLTMALAGRVATDWAGDPGAILDYAVRFTRPVVVPDDDDGTDLVVAGRVARLQRPDRDRGAHRDRGGRRRAVRRPRRAPADLSQPASPSRVASRPTPSVSSASPSA
jgi:acyl dehydratase